MYLITKCHAVLFGSYECTESRFAFITLASKHPPYRLGGTLKGYKIPRCRLRLQVLHSISVLPNWQIQRTNMKITEPVVVRKMRYGTSIYSLLPS